MSLKMFHILFIVCSVLLCIIFSIWGFANYHTSPTMGYLWAGVGSLTASVGLAIYGINFYKKLDKL